MQYKISNWLMVLGCAAHSLSAQVPINDMVTVSFATPVHVGSTTLPAGEYTIRQLPSASQPRLLEFSTAKGTHIETTVTTIASIDNNDNKDTSVILKQNGGESYLHQIWIKGKTYGYELPVDLAPSTMTATSNRGMKLTATYTAAEPVQVASAETVRKSPEVAPEPTPAPRVAEPEPTPAPVATPAPAPVAAPVPAPEPTVAQAQEPRPVAKQTRTPRMPKTSLDWASFAFAGCTMLLLAGLAYKPRQRQ